MGWYFRRVCTRIRPQDTIDTRQLAFGNVLSPPLPLRALTTFPHDPRSPAAPRWDVFPKGIKYETSEERTEF
jgi:hypothetical protein